MVTNLRVHLFSAGVNATFLRSVLHLKIHLTVLNRKNTLQISNKCSIISTREVFVMSEKDNNKIDVMCTHTMDGKIIPMKIRLKDEDGMYQTFAVRAYRDLSVSGNYTLGNEVVVTGVDIYAFEVKILVFGVEKTMRITYHKRENVWRK